MTLLLTALAFAQDPLGDDDLPEMATPTAPAPAPAGEAPAGEAPPAAPAPAPAPAPVGPVSQAMIQAAVDGWYGKPVPAPALCVERPKLPAPFEKEVVAVGVTKKNAGCRLRGVMVAGVGTETAEAFTAALAGTTLDAAAKQAAAKVWTTEVLLAFDAPIGEASLKPGVKGAFTVVAPYGRRSDEYHVSEKYAGLFPFDANGKLGTTATTPTERWRTDLYQQEVAVQGFQPGVVDAAVKTVGGAISECFEEKIASDPGFDGSTRIAMVVAAGKIEKLGAEEESDAELTRCYANALYRATWTPTAKGSAVWSFAIVKSAL